MIIIVIFIVYDVCIVIDGIDVQRMDNENMKIQDKKEEEKEGEGSRVEHGQCMKCI